MLSPEMVQIGALLLGTLSVAGLVYAVLYPFISSDRQTEKRFQGIAENRSKRAVRTTQVDQLANNRRKAVADSLKELEDRQKAKEKVSLRLRLQRSGLDLSPKAFWIASAVSGFLTAVILYLTLPTLPPVFALGTAAAGAFVGTMGLPRWVLRFLTRRRQNKFLDEFANAIDVIVRGVKSGLPLNECLNIIARESPQPIAGEFQELVEQQRVGVTLQEGFERMMQRTPLAEVKFFSIVVAIQQQAGGNLSEALGNLSGVLRDRKRLQAKVRALSAEAKASAGVLGSLPVVVMLLVYFTTPGYMALLWTTKMGQFLLCCAGIWMTCGCLVMRKMINFKY